VSRSRKGLDKVICLQRASDRFSDELDSSKKFSLSLDVLQTPERAGGVKKRLKVLTEKASGTLVKIPFFIFVAMPGVMTM